MSTHNFPHFVKKFTISYIFIIFHQNFTILILYKNFILQLFEINLLGLYLAIKYNRYEDGKSNPKAKYPTGLYLPTSLNHTGSVSSRRLTTNKAPSPNSQSLFLLKQLYAFSKSSFSSYFRVLSILLLFFLFFFYIR